MKSIPQYTTISVHLIHVHDNIYVMFKDLQYSTVYYTVALKTDSRGQQVQSSINIYFVNDMYFKQT